jgi:hypothetical protein
MLFEHAANLLEPCFVVPQQARFLFMPDPIGGEDGFHLQFRQRYLIQYSAYGPHVLSDFVVGQGSYVIWTIHVIKVEGFIRIIRVMHIRIKEIFGDVAGFLH